MFRFAGLDKDYLTLRQHTENYEVISKVYDWFKDDLFVIGSTDHPGLVDITAKMFTTAPMKELILKALVQADVGIDDVSVDIKKIKIGDLPKDMPPEIKKLVMSNKEEVEQTKISTIHKGISFSFEEESDGTMRLFSLIGPWIDALKKGCILIVDELDTKLHHLLNVFLIELFHNQTQNKNNAQLIFTTHNTNLLDIQDIFRRDQIWFTEKNQKTGATDLYSLAEYSPRKDKNIERGYLAGKYGALPFIKENKIFQDE
jgi:AAA15 family ATPase/GTPase